MKKVINRICSFLLILVMLITALPIAAIAASTEMPPDEIDDTESYDQDSVGFSGEPVLAAGAESSQSEDIELGREIFIFINGLINDGLSDEQIEEKLLSGF